MVVAILNILFLVLAITVFIAWIKAIADWDGKCHNDCKGCPYDDGHCKFKEERKNGR